MLANKTRLISFIVALVGGIWAWMIHSSNLQYYHQRGGIDGIDMIFTADDASYVVPARNFYQTGIWKDNSEGVSAYIQRPPMIGMIHYVFLNLKLESEAQKYVAILLHGLAIFLLGLMCMEKFGKTKGVVVQCTYAILPCFWGYLFYFLTESITASLLIFLLYGYYKFQQKNSPKWLLNQALIIGILLLTRPQLVLFILPFLYFLWTYVKNKFHNRWLTVFLSILLAFGGFISWQVRSINIAGEWKGVHPIYDESNISEYRPVHRSFGNLFRIWEDNGAKFHGIMGKFRYESIEGIPDATDMALTQIPDKVFKHVSEDELRHIFNQYHDHIQTVYKTKPTKETPNEKQLREEVDKLTARLRTKMWKDNYIITPFHSIKWMFTKSQLNLLIFQKKYRGQWWMEGLRYFCVIFIAIITMLSLSHIVNGKNIMFLLMGLSILIYLFYLFFIQKMNEERYLMPLLPIFLLMAFDKANCLIGRKEK